MTQRNSLSELLEQTRRINKTVDQICMETIDGIVGTLNFVDRKLILKNKDFFDRFCEYYHKPNPIKLVRGLKAKDMARCHSCRNGKFALIICSNYIQGSIDRCWKGISMVQEVWWEVVDFLWERPELVNTALLDEYVQSKIAEVCASHKKENPLKNGMWKRFGRYWRDKRGRWRVERRNRF